MDSFIGKCIDNKYNIKELIASGGMGEVYLAHQKGAEQIVAVKTLKREYHQDRVVVERFINEARLYGRVTHPNIVKLHDILNVSGRLCIIMEYVAGKTLSHYLASDYVFSTRQIIDIAIQIADALATLHKVGIIHRDLKTDNIMLIETVSGRFSVKILDFGIAKFKDSRSKSVTQPGVIVGTPEFMSPEQCLAQPIDLRTDIYSFGILLYCIICGRLPFEAPSALAMLHKQTTEPLPKLKRPDSSSVPTGLVGIVRKCTQKVPDARYQTFVEVIADLTCLQEGRKTSVEHVALSFGQSHFKFVTEFWYQQGSSSVKYRFLPVLLGLLVGIAAVVIVIIVRFAHHSDKVVINMGANNQPPPDTEQDNNAGVPNVAALETQNNLLNTGLPAHEIRESDIRRMLEHTTGTFQQAIAFAARPNPIFAKLFESNAKTTSEYNDKTVDAEASRSKHRRRRSGHTSDDETNQAILQIAGKPPCTLSIDGKKYGSTPQRIALPTGNHKILCTNKRGVSERAVTLSGGEVQRIVFQDFTSESQMGIGQASLSDKDSMKRAVDRELSSAIEDCSSIVENGDKILPAKIEVMMTVLPSGSISAFKIYSSNAPDFINCLERQKAKWHFQPFRGDAMVLKQTYYKR